MSVQKPKKEPRKKRRKVRPKCKLCVYYSLLPKPGRKVPCVSLKRESNMPACTKFSDKRKLTCSDCIMFLYGTCPYKKQEPTSSICPMFKHKNLLLDVDIRKVRNPVNRSLDTAMQNGFVGILAHIFSFEKAAYASLEQLNKEFEQNDLAVPIATGQFERIVSRITKLFLTNQLCQLCGIGHMAEDVVKHELAMEKILAQLRIRQ